MKTFQMYQQANLQALMVLLLPLGFPKLSKLVQYELLGYLAKALESFHCLFVRVSLPLIMKLFCCAAF